MTNIATCTHAHHHAHHTTDKKTSGFKKKLKKVGDFFKGTDGWDELGSGIGQTLPGIGQHIATLSVLSILTPFVYLGVKGMASEMDEAKENLHEIQETKKALLEKIQDIFKLKLDPNIFNKGANNFENLTKTLKHYVNDKDFKEKAELFSEYANNLIQEKIAKTADDATPYGLTAMTGMLGGMVAATLRSGAEIASTAHPTIHALETTALALEIATAGFFIPAQIAMIVYAGKKVDEGKIIQNKLEHDKESVKLLYHLNDTQELTKDIKNVVSEYKIPIDIKEALNKLSDDNQNNNSTDEISKSILNKISDIIDKNTHNTIEISKNFHDAIQDNLDRKLHYNKLGKIIYGKGLALSEAGMVAGGLLGFVPGINATIAPAILVPSAVSTIGFAGLRIYAQNKEGKFTGEAHDHIHDGNISHAWQNTMKRMKNKFFGKKDTHTHHHEEHHHHHTHHAYHHNPQKSHEEEFNEFTKKLAEQKLNSLTLHALSSEKPEEKLKKLVATGKKSFFRKTTLQKDVLLEMQKISSEKPKNHTSLSELSSSKEKLQQFLMDIFDIKNVVAIKDYIKDNAKLRDKLNKISRKNMRHKPFNDNDIIDERAFERAWNDPKILKEFCKHAISYEKNKSKSKRQAVIDDIIHQANILHLIKSTKEQINAPA